MNYTSVSKADLLKLKNSIENANAYKSTTIFIDSTYAFRIDGGDGKNIIDSVHLYYTLDTTTTPSFLHMEGVDNNNEKWNINWFIKLVDKNILKIQGWSNGEIPKKWIRHETAKNTFIFIRQ